MTTQEKILVPTVNTAKSNIVLDTAGYNMPEGFSAHTWHDGTMTLRDEVGRLNVSWMYQLALAQDPGLGRKTPNEWLRGNSTKELRANYMNMIGFDPVKIVRGGDRGKGENQNGISRFGNSLNISANGNVQTYGTYMTDRMVASYAAWVSFSFKCYVDDIFHMYGGFHSASGLILPTDELHKENVHINQRYNNWMNEIGYVPDNFKQGCTNLKDIQDYVTLLNTGWNISISVSEYCKWLCSEGLMYAEYAAEGEVHDVEYKVRPNWMPGLFSERTVVDSNNLMRSVVVVTNDGHLATIQRLLVAFPPTPG